MLNYLDTLHYLYSQLPMYQRVGAPALKKDLTNIRKLCTALGNPQERLRCIHIGGTNGKGSTAHMLSAVLQAAGLRVGLYTSPHYRDFRERIKINRDLVPEDWITRFVHTHRSLFDDIQPSFFEITVAMAFLYFAEQETDVAIIEVGLGGRLDSTNIIVPELCVITNISFDHMQFLGNTLEAIAGEKAGIIKPGIPVVIGETQPETAPVFLAKAEKEQTEITFADQTYEARLLHADFSNSVYDIYRKGVEFIPNLQVDIYGDYQRFNIQTVICAVQKLATAWSITEEHLRAGLANIRESARFIGRWQVLGYQPLILCDSAHNEAGIKAVTQQLKRIPHQALHMVLGVVNDKDLDTFFTNLPSVAHFYYTRPDVPRGLPASELASAGHSYGRAGTVWPSVKEALEAARQKAQPADLIFVGGSIFVVAEVV